MSSIKQILQAQQEAERNSGFVSENLEFRFTKKVKTAAGSTKNFPKFFFYLFIGQLPACAHYSG